MRVHHLRRVRPVAPFIKRKHARVAKPLRQRRRVAPVKQAQGERTCAHRQIFVRFEL